MRVFDVGYNRFRGRLPAQLGDIAQNLSTAKVHFNRLACELPHGVQYWNGDGDVSVLTGNRFACPIPETTTCSKFGKLFSCPYAGLAMVDADASAYSCGFDASWTSVVASGCGAALLTLRWHPAVFRPSQSPGTRERIAQNKKTANKERHCGAR